MPPIRNMTMPIKPMKTERTHEENQERAYIAASRRSDRSLEARIESARRASEIHKRRTGRSLRVREEDVVNEEMYEEEDDDLPQQYRRLTAHLATSNTEFDRRLRAYLTNQVAMRTVFGQAAVAGGWQQDQQQDQQFLNPNNNRFMNPAMMSMGPPMSNFSPNNMSPPTAFAQSGQSYRQSPYPAPASRPNAQGRSQSVASPTNIAPHPSNQSQSAQTSPVDRPSSHDRRMSMPAQSAATPQEYQHQPSPAMNASSPHNNSPSVNIPSNPLSSVLPLESQQLLAGGPFFNYTDPFATMFDNNASSMDLKLPQQQGTQPMYSYNPNGNNASFKSPNAQADQPQQLGGLDQTLWGMGNSDDNMFKTEPSNTDDFNSFGGAPGGDSLGFGGHSAYSSGHVTPNFAKEEWENFLDGGAFDESAAPS